MRILKYISPWILIGLMFFFSKHFYRIGYMINLEVNCRLKFVKKVKNTL